MLKAWAFRERIVGKTVTLSWTKSDRSWQDIYLNEWSAKSLDDILSDGVIYLPRKPMCRLLYNGAETTLKRDLSCLVPMKNKPKGFDFKPQDGGFSRESMRVLFEFRKLVKQFQYETAVDKIHQRMEEIYGISECSTKG
ncbi:hypothetical protein CK516_26085 [Nostoc sp. 'Peltigera malacea cyanobiont' DB3992]|nr:hypothetical protein CK516_26085 [Nostoc sp. 'Peltigera malacea cyanobiont' DB3992]